MRHADTFPRSLAAIAAGITLLSVPGADAAEQQDGLETRAALLDRLETELGLGGDVVDLALDHTPGLPLVAEIEIAGEMHTLDLRPHDLRAPGYRLLVTGPGGTLVDHEPGPVRTLRGEVLGRPGSSVAAMLEDDGLHAMINLGDDTGHYWLEPVSALLADDGAPGEHVLYHDSDVEVHAGTCGLRDEVTMLGNRAKGRAGIATEAEGGSDGGTASGSVPCQYIAEIALDADWEYFDGPGQNNVTTTENRMIAVINAVSAQYDSEVDIDFTITTIIVRDDSNDPYSSTLIAGQLLNEFQNHWNIFHQNIDRDFAELFTGRNFSGTTIGIANLAVICTNMAYSVVMDELFFACRTDLSSHEIGHNWSAQHCNCPGNTMNPSLTCANSFSTVTENSIIAHRNSRPCLEVLCPPDNDNCDDAIAVGTGDTPFSTIFSTTAGPAENSCPEGSIASDIWFTYVAPCTGDITFSLCDADYNTTIAIYDGHGCPSADSAIACNDDFCGEQSQITINATEDQELLIRIGGNFAVQGTGTLNISVAPDCIAIPGNDTCSSATTANLGTTFFVTSGAASEGFTEGQCDLGANTQIDKDIWYRHIASCDGQLRFSLCGSSYNTRMAIYSGTCPGGPDEAIACSDDFCGNQSELTIDAPSGVYRIRIGGFDGDAGFGQLEIECIDDPPPACPGDTNDDGQVNVDDLNNVILDWGTDGTANGGDLTDATGTGPPDGVVDVNDLNAVIVNWGACP